MTGYEPVGRGFESLQPYHVAADAISFAAAFFKSHRSLILSRLLSKPQPLCWVAVWSLVQTCSCRIFFVVAIQLVASVVSLAASFFHFIPKRIARSLCRSSLQIGSASLGFDFASRLQRLFQGEKAVIRPLSCPSFPNRNRYAGLRFGFWFRPTPLHLFSAAIQLVASVVSLAASFLFHSKTRRPLTLPLLASKSDPLRWALTL